MNFFTIFTLGYIILAVVLIYIIYRDQRQPTILFGRHKFSAWCLIVFLFFTSLIAYYTRFIEPFNISTKQEVIKIANLKRPIKIAFITDPQLNRFKTDKWVEIIVQKTDALSPDLIIFGGDMISNGGYFYDTGNDSIGDEDGFLYGFSNLTKKYLNYYILGNHEYGLGNSSRRNSDKWTGDHSTEVTMDMDEIGSKSLANNLACLEIDNQKICLFGINDIWADEANLTNIDFSALKNWDQKIPLVFITHNPDGILYWPKNIKKPDLILAGHSHGGQIFLPFFGPLGDAGINLGKQYYRGLNYYDGTPIYTSNGLGESGGPIRFMAAPELTTIILTEK